MLTILRCNMPQTITVAEAHANFHALVRLIVEQDESIIITSQGQPQVVLVRWETYQQQQRVRVEDAQHRLLRLTTEMESITARLQESFRPDSLDVTQGVQTLSLLVHKV
jgi:prevent-host-death family protein